MIQESTKEISQKLMEAKGEVRGTVFKTDMEFILKEKGEEGLKKVEKEAEKLGFPIEYKKIKIMNFYPVGLRVISLLAIKRALNLEEKDIQRIGFFATKKSLILKLFIKYFFSIEKVFYQEAPKIWEKHYTFGKLIPFELNKEKEYAILRLEGFSFHPLFCIDLGGYFCGIVQMLIKADKIFYEETKCPHRGDAYHEYFIRWSELSARQP